MQGVCFQGATPAEAPQQGRERRRCRSSPPAQTPRTAPVLAQMSFQDFLREVDLQFLDHMRRGTSINFADLASDPLPSTLQV